MVDDERVKGVIILTRHLGKVRHALFGLRTHPLQSVNGSSISGMGSACRRTSMRLPTFERSEVLLQINDAAPTSSGRTVSRILRLRYGWGVGVDLGAVKEISFDGKLSLPEAL
jgi:hypothetical protein